MVIEENFLKWAVTACLQKKKKKTITASKP